MRYAVGALVALVAGTAVVAVSPQAAQADGIDPPWATCTQHSVPVTLSATDPTVYNMVGRLCLRDDANRRNTVQLMVSGLTYDHSYFNISHQPQSYSQVWAATSRGYNTFNVDRVGVGLSDKAPAVKLDVPSHAFAIQQVVRRLRLGLGGRVFTTVVGVGHSLGAAVLQYAAGTSTDPTGLPNYLVLSDMLTGGNPAGVVVLSESIYPAVQDPKFAGAGLPADYITTKPGTRAPSFFSSSTDPALVALDEAAKSTGALSERNTLGLARTPTVTRNIQVPVLITVGQFDILQCNESIGVSCANAAAVMARESANFTARACLKAFVVDGAGHSTNYHLKALDSYNFINNWLDYYTINGVGQKDANGCLP
jgi:pimeloyl-ACP methyl ester carboxylesterase